MFVWAPTISDLLIKCLSELFIYKIFRFLSKGFKAKRYIEFFLSYKKRKKKKKREIFTIYLFRISKRYIIISLMITAVYDSTHKVIGGQVRKRMVDTSNGDTSMPQVDWYQKLRASLASSLYNSDNHKSFKQIKERHNYLIPIFFVGPVPRKHIKKGEAWWQ